MDLRLFAIDVVAIGILAFALYVPRHRRKDLAVALVGVNVGVLAVTVLVWLTARPHMACWYVVPS